MKNATGHADVQTLNIGYEEFLPVFDGFSEGVLIVDRWGRIIYYNNSMATIDDLIPDDVLGMTVTDVYDLSDDSSVIMQCLKTQAPIVDRPLLYRTRRGKVANTIHTVFPLFKRDRLEGAICLVRDYNVLEETISSISIPRSKRLLPNDTRFDFDAIVGTNIDFLRAVNTAKMAAATPSPVMLCGETGTGKELFAQAIHNHSGRKSSRYRPNPNIRATRGHL
jgi:arginine utilization regulatory protein